jgi:hypothetical protein
LDKGYLKEIAIYDARKITREEELCKMTIHAKLALAAGKAVVHGYSADEIVKEYHRRFKTKS